MKKIIKYLFLAVMLVAFMTACSTIKDTDDDSTKTITDMAGVKVEIPTSPQKVVCISPTYTEYMIAFDMGNTLVGTHKNSLNKVWLNRIYPDIDKLKAYSYSATAEDVLATGADLVIVTQNEVAETLRAAGIPAVTMTLDNSEDPYYHIRLFGEILGGETPDKINAWIAETEAVKTEINRVLDENNIQTGPSVYMINGQSNKGLFYAQAGGGSAMEGFLNSIRATLALKDFDGGSGIMPTEEEILRTNPEVVTIGGAFGVPMREEMLSDPVWKDIEAVKNGRVYIIPIGGIGWDQDYLTMPVMLKYFANIFYPELFNYDLTESVISYYQKYYDVTLTETEVAYMLNDLTPGGENAWE